MARLADSSFSNSRKAQALLRTISRSLTGPKREVTTCLSACSVTLSTTPWESNQCQQENNAQSRIRYLNKALWMCNALGSCVGRMLITTRWGSRRCGCIRWSAGYWNLGNAS